jgi:hypothetical protein
MFPIFAPEFIRAEQAYRLEGYHRWMRRHGQTIRPVEVDSAPRSSRRHSRRLRFIASR